MSSLENEIRNIRSELCNIRKQINGLKCKQQKDIQTVRDLLNDDGLQSFHGKKSSPAQIPTDKFEWTHLKPIGFVRSVFETKNGTPRQAGVVSSAFASLTLQSDLFTNPEHSLEGLEKFSHIWVIFVFHQNKNTYTKAKVKPPRLNGVKTGLFSTRCPYRPNPIGLSLVKLERIEGSRVYISGVDLIDGTPVVDIKPFIPQYDQPNTPNVYTEAEVRANYRKAMSCGTSSDLNPLLIPEEKRSQGTQEKRQSYENLGMTIDSFKSQEAMFVGPTGPCNNQGVITTYQSTSEIETTLSEGGRPNSLGDGLNSEMRKTPDLETYNSNVLKCRHGACQNKSVDFNCEDGAEKKEDNQLVEQNISGVKENISVPVASQTQTHSDCGSGRSNASANSMINSQQFKVGSKDVDKLGPEKETNEIMIADWITRPPIALLKVQFTTRAEKGLEHLNFALAYGHIKLKQARSISDIRSAIINVLASDPRSTYRRTKCADRLYYFSVDIVHATCWFDDEEKLVQIFKIKYKE